ncbi:MAG: hypothetical protein WA830_24945 [Candidatus Sulfotelmatobacter sp.]
MRSRGSMFTLSLLLLTFFLLTASTFAIPAFSRQYGTSCTTCHIDFPKLNDFGKAFKDAGFKFPKDDESFLKVPPVMLGAPAQKELWPHTVFPGTIPGLPPIGLRFNQFFQYTPSSANNYNPAGSPAAPNVPRTDFEPGLFSIFMAGNFGSDIAFWVDDDLSVSGSNANGGLGDGYLKFVNIGRFMKLPTDSLTLRVGQFELDLPFSQARSINITPWDIYTEANIGSGQQNVNNVFAIQDAAQGIELSGGHQYGGYHYSLAFVNQNTSGTSSQAPNVSSPGGFFSDANYKDIYANFSYRFNLERDPASRHDIMAAGPTGPRDHTYLSLGTYFFKGRSVQRFNGLDAADNVAVITAREPFYRVGGDFSFNYRTLNIFGFYMYGHDDDRLCQDATGTAVPCSSGVGTSFIPGAAAKFNGGFVEADYLVLPWIMTILRYDRVQSTADFLNQAGSSNYYSPAGTTRSRVTPGVQFLIHANIKASFEYAIRPQQALIYDSNGKPLNSFRTNTTAGALEFVY